MNLTYHAKEMQRERGLTNEEVELVVRKGSKIRQQDKIRVEFGQWAVVFKKAKKVENKIFIITLTYR